MKHLTIFFLTFSFFSASCQKIGISVNETAEAQTGDKPSVIKLCLQKPDSQSSQIDLRRIPHITNIEFINPNKIWFAALSKEIYHTEDTGKTWRKLSLQNAEFFETFDFLDEHNGWLADTDNNIWKTIDGGKNWRQIYSSKPPSDAKFRGIQQLKFTSAENGWLRDTFGVFHTMDGGTSWRKVAEVVAQPQEMFFVDDMHGWITFAEGSEKSPLWILRTADGGQTWKKSKIQAANSTESIFFLDNQKGWVSNADDELFVTENAGENWSKTDAGAKNFQTRGIYWLDSKQGWLAGATVDPNAPVSSNAASFPTLLNTGDSGQTWNKFETPNDEYFFDKIYFSDSTNGWLISRDAIYKTSDGGKNWKAAVKLDLSCL